MEQADTPMQEIETGNFAIPRWVLCPPSFVRVVNWNINRGLQLQRVIEFLASTKADIVHLQESDLNARRTRPAPIGSPFNGCTSRSQPLLESAVEAAKQPVQVLCAGARYKYGRGRWRCKLALNADLIRKTRTSRFSTRGDFCIRPQYCQEQRNADSDGRFRKPIKGNPPGRTRPRH